MSEIEAQRKGGCMNTKTDTKKYTFEILTLNGKWRRISGRSLNSIDDETGSSVFAASGNGRPYVCYGIEAAKDSLNYFGKIAGHHRVRIANGTKFEYQNQPNGKGEVWAVPTM